MNDTAPLIPLTPPKTRSRAALGLADAAAEGKFKLQVCADCGTIQYPPRDACSNCLSVELPWQKIDRAAELLAETRIRISPDPYFRTKPAWRAGTVRLKDGPSIICHLHQTVQVGETVRLDLKLDRAGHGVIMAFPEKGASDMLDDPQLQEMICDPKGRRVLVTDGSHSHALAIAKALIGAGAKQVFVGRKAGTAVDERFAGLGAVEVVDLDVKDTQSVQDLAETLADKIEILINTARTFQPGGVIAQADTGFAQQDMDVNYFGLMRLAQAFGPAMCLRTTDRDRPAVAWVNLLSIYSLVNAPVNGCHSASQAAALSLSQNMRADFRSAGLRVMNVFHGPFDDASNQHLPPPKLTANALARDVVQGLQRGLEDVYSGDIAQEIKAKFDAGPKLLERELTSG